MEVAPIEDIYYTKEEHYDFLTTIDNWSNNRPPDETRVEAIKDSLMKRQPTHIDGIMLVWNKPDGSLQCFDGIHRLRAIMDLERDACKDTRILIRHYKGYSEGQIIDEFIRINKTIPVSSIYTKKEAELEMRLTIESVVKHIQQTYPQFFKPSSKPNTPHINRDIFMEKLVEMIENDERKRSWDTTKWLHYLKQISNTIESRNAAGIRSYRITKRALEKCKKYDFWLFAHKTWWSVI